MCGVCVCMCADHVTLVSVNSLESTASGSEDVAVRQLSSSMTGRHKVTVFEPSTSRAGSGPAVASFRSV